MSNKKLLADTESVRLRKVIMKKVRANKKKTGFPIGRFIEDAVVEKLNKENAN